MNQETQRQWLFCLDQMPTPDDADPWGNVFVVFVDDEEGEPEMAPVKELLQMVEGHSGNGLPPKLHFHWMQTGLMPVPERRNVN